MNLFSKIFGCFRRSPVLESEAQIRRDLLTAVDITRLPPAVGFLRDIQLADVELLRETMRVAKLVGVHPWMIGGGLIGMLRHGGRFIPWDDDLDLVLIREEYERFVDLFNANCRPGFRAYYKYHGKFCRIKVAHQDLPDSVDLSIFVFDRFWKALPQLADKRAFRARIDRVQDQIKHRARGLDVAAHRRLFDEFRARDVLEGHPPAPDSERPALFFGAELRVFRFVTSIIYDYEDVYPLRPGEFEGVEVLLPNRGENILTYMYGNWGAFPNSLCNHHRSSEFSVEKALALRRFLTMSTAATGNP